MAFPPKKQLLGGSCSESNLSVNSRLSGARRDKLLNLKKREDFKDQLMEKFKGRYGHGANKQDDEMSVASTCIRREVDRFADRANMTDNNLGRLERRLRAHADGRTQDESASTVSGVSAYSQSSRLTRASRSLASLHGESVVRNGNGNMAQDFDWAKLDEYAAYLHEQDSLRQRAGVSALQRKLRNDLDSQVADKRVKAERSAEEERRFHQNQQLEMERWKEVEQERADEMRAKIMKEKRDRDEQLALDRNLKDSADQQKKQEETNLVEKITYEMEAEQDRMDRKRQNTRTAMKKVFEENMADQRMREDGKREQTERESSAMREYNKILDAQEEERSNELQNRMGKQKALMEQMQANVAQVQQAKGDDDERRVRAQQEEGDRCAFEAEMNKQSRLKQMKQETQAFLFKQMAEKDDRKNNDLELKGLQAHILDADSKEYNEIELQKKVDKRSRNVDHRFELERQMVNNASRKKPAMSETEVKMNRRLLNLVDRTFEGRDDDGMGNEDYEMGPEDAAVP